jgi:hypothetical protein
MRWGRIVVAAVLVEVIAVLLLFALVALLGPADADAAQGYAERQGRWVGPVGGSLATLGLSYWAASGSARPLRTGTWVGGLAAAIDVAILLLAAPFEPLFGLSNGLRLAAGWAGGRLAARARS